MPRSAKGDLPLARGDLDACTASFAPSPRPAILRAWDQPLRHRAVSRPPGQLFFTQALQTLPPGAAVPASSCMRMPPDPMPSSTPWGREGGDRAIVEYHVSYCAYSRRGTQRRPKELEYRECNVGMAVGSRWTQLHRRQHDVPCL